MGRKIILDFGTHHGEGLHKMIQVHGADETWQIYSFEANPYTYTHFEALRDAISGVDGMKSRLPWLDWDITYVNKAVWSENKGVGISCVRDKHEKINLEKLYDESNLGGDHITIALSKHFVSGASTIMIQGNEEAMDDADARTVVRTEAFDVAEWFENNLQEDDFVALKVDIEGAEYEVLKQLISTGAIDRVNWIAVEFHPEAMLSTEKRVWLKGYIDGYLTRMQDKGELTISTWV